ncbi:MAG TPA: GIY-YIG nuclease family protein [Verrucomicrobiae bacterium]|nr:GIY-YIG nuclease family protein [Verrucomicrobiae bacterium]
MNEKPSRFADIFHEEDPLGLLAQKPAGPTRSSEEEIVIGQFQAINAFIDEHGIAPGSTENRRRPSLHEYTLEGNLEAFLASESFRQLLAPFDRHGLLGPAAAAAPVPATIEDILASDDPLLVSSAEDIFDLKHVGDPRTQPTVPDEIARRRPASDFERFAPIFAELREDLKSGRRFTKRFEGEATIKPGAAFILGGIIAYVAAVDERERRGKDYNGRIRVIFDNGTESNYLWRSFARAFYEDENGRQILETAPTVTGPLFGRAGHIAGPLFTGEPGPDEFGEIKGTVYIVESLSADPNIVALRGKLYKIGFTTQDVKDRFTQAEKDPTFLCADVHLCRTFETNFNPRKLERLLHQFFVHANLQIDVVLGKRVQPKEWFVVPLDLVEEAVTRILDRSIVHYRYDAISRKILPR